MRQAKKWPALDGWSYNNYFWHYYNTYMHLPRWMYTARTIITLLLTYPILFQIPLLENRQHNQIFTAMIYVSHQLIYFEWSSMQATVSLGLVFALLSVMFVVIGYASDKLVFSRTYGYVMRFIFEILSPIMFLIEGASAQHIGSAFVEGRRDYFMLFGTVLSALVFLVLFAMATFARTRSIYFSGYFFDSWSSGVTFLKTVVPTFMLQLLILRRKNEAVGTYVFICTTFVYAAVLLVIDARIQYLNFFANVGYLSLHFATELFSVLHLIAYIYNNISVALILLIIVILSVVSVISAMMLYNHYIGKYTALSIPVDVNHTGRAGDDDSDQISIPSDVDDIGANHHKLIYSSELKDSYGAIDILHYMVMTGGDPLDLALFLLENSTKPLVKFECYRVLMMEKIATKDMAHQIMEKKKNDVPFFCRQALCDMIFESMAFTLTDQDLAPFMSDLEEICTTVKEKLRDIAESIRMNDSGRTKELVQEYSRACDHFEERAHVIITHAPRSSELARVFADFYQNLRGDWISSQYWSAREDALKNRGGLRMTHYSHSRDISSYTSPKGNDATTLNKIKSQTVVQRVKSSAIINTSLTFALVVIFGMVCAFYRRWPAYMDLIMSDRMDMCLYKISRFIYYPGSAQINMSMQILQNYDPTSYPLLQDANKTLIFPTMSTVNWISEMFQNISDVVSNLDRSMKSAKKAISLWSDHDIPSKYTNYTLQYLSVQLNMMASLLAPLTCDANGYEFLEVFFDNFYVMLHRLVNLYTELMNYSEECWSTHEQWFWVITSLFAVIFCTLGVLVIVLSIILSRRERDKFWNVYSAVEEDFLIAFRDSMTDDQVEMEGESKGKSYRLSIWHPLQGRAFIVYTVIILTIFTVVYFLQMDIVDWAHERYMNTYRDARDFDLAYDKMLMLSIICTMLHTNTTSRDKFMGLLRESISVKKFDMKPRSADITDDYTEMMNLAMITEGIGAKFNSGTGTNEDILSLITLTWHNATIVAERNLQWRQSQINIMFSKRTTNYHSTMTSVCVLLAIYAFIFISRVIAYHREFISMKAVLMLLPSNFSSTVANLMTQFEATSKKSETTNNKFQARYIVRQAVDAVVVIDNEQSIQDINKVAVEMLGYNKDQLIGESIQSFIARRDDDQQTTEFFSQLSFLKGQSTATPRFNLHMVRSNGTLVPVSCTLLPITSETVDYTETQGCVPSCALILRDRTVFTEQERKLQDAKKTVEKLLYRILPRVMANKLLSKNQILHSKVDRATVIFIAIVNFLDWCRTHTHTEIMELLDVIFTKFDKNISKFPTLVKLKVINGVYMAAGGLFNEVSDKSHELEAVLFAIKCAKSIKKRNLLTKSNLQLQIGINTGGPVIAGILGSDKPLFDVWGDAVNVSARLETSDPFDFIQMSLETGNSLPKGMFNLQEKEGVFLKGKGYTTTYLLDLSELI